MKKVLAIIPSHNEEKNLPGLMQGLKSQTYPTDVCIVSDNSTDRTAEVARELGATIVTETVGNTGMRSGAINWGLDHFSEGYDYILAMDADSTCSEDMIEQGVKALEADPKLGAVCSRCGVLPQPELKSLEQRLLWHIQHLEYGCYDSARVETTGKIKVAHGLATMFSRKALDQQKAKHGFVYNVEALAEDYHLTLDLKELGWRISSCQKMRAWTIVPTRLGWLSKQRTRWNLGGLDALLAHGLFRPITFWDSFNLTMSIILLLVEIIVLMAIGYIKATGGEVYVSDLFYLVVGAMWFNSIYRMRYCQNVDVWDILMTVSFIPSVLYYYFLVATQIKAYKQFLQGAERKY
jgi:biofilm PGA synthesis N-glycosyltransferase PgaC